MEIQTSLWEKPVLPADIVYTPTYVSEHIVRWLNPKGNALTRAKAMELFIIICLKITEIIVRYERAKTFLPTMKKWTG